MQYFKLFTLFPVLWATNVWAAALTSPNLVSREDCWKVGTVCTHNEQCCEFYCDLDLRVGDHTIAYVSMLIYPQSAARKGQRS